MKNDIEHKIGHYAFIAGVLLAILLGLMPASFTISNSTVALLVILGFIVGILNIKTKDSNSFLIAAITLMIGASAYQLLIGTIPAIGVYLQQIMLMVVVFVAPASLIVALKSIYGLAK